MPKYALLRFLQADLTRAQIDGMALLTMANLENYIYRGGSTPIDCVSRDTLGAFLLGTRLSGENADVTRPWPCSTSSGPILARSFKQHSAVQFTVRVHGSGMPKSRLSALHGIAVATKTGVN